MAPLSTNNPIISVFFTGVDTLPPKPENRIRKWANGARIGVIGGRVLFEAGILLFSLYPRKKAIAKTGVLFISMDFRSSEKRFASQQVLLAVISSCNIVPK
jgi:hypothetical protein